jgi:hypothetical protein
MESYNLPTNNVQQKNRSDIRSYMTAGVSRFGVSDDMTHRGFESPATAPGLLARVRLLKDKSYQNSKRTTILMTNAKTLLEKCVLNREYSDRNSDTFERVIKHDLQLYDAPDKMSGDASKNGLNIEIKCSTHSKHCTFNYVQIRPDHNVHYYLFVGYNLFHTDALGKEYLFKIPSEDLYQIIVEYGHYAHGSKMVLPPVITLATMKGNGYEYALRVNPNAKKKGTKQWRLWDTLLKYKVDYNPNLFLGLRPCKK